MHEIVLTGLKADVPIGAMAAFGLLRVCDTGAELGGVRLHWRRQGANYCAVLSTEVEIGGDGLLSVLVNHMRGAGTRRELTWAKAIDKTLFTERAKAALATATAWDHQEADWFAAFTTDLSERETTPFDTTAGNQGFLSMALELAHSLGPGEGNENKDACLAAFREAMFGPWTYQDSEHSFGWDPWTVRLGAFTGEAPERIKTKRSVRAAVWLAFESLPLFPCFCPVSGSKRLRTRAYARRNRHFSWPVWDHPLSLATLRSLLSLSQITEDPPEMRELRTRGVRAVFRSERVTRTRYGNFQPAVLCG
jgi:hypothetical protein